MKQNKQTHPKPKLFPDQPNPTPTLGATNRYAIIALLLEKTKRKKKKDRKTGKSTTTQPHSRKTHARQALCTPH